MVLLTKKTTTKMYLEKSSKQVVQKAHLHIFQGYLLLSRHAGSKVEENQHITGCQAVHPQLMQCRLWWRISSTCPISHLLLGLFKEIPEQNR